MKSGWIDSHAHIASIEHFENIATVKEAAIEMGVTKINIICGNMKELKRALEHIEGDPMFDISLGVHPMELRELSEAEIIAMEDYYTHPQVVCVGEIGMDSYWDTSYREDQEAMFIRHIHLANKYNLPIAVHIRNEKDGSSAVDDALRILQAHPVTCKGVIHCYCDTVENAEKFLEMGFYLGFGGIMTFKNGQNVRDVLAITPADRILTETDAPYLAPVPKRGKQNQPAYVSYVGKALNNHFGRDMKDQITENYRKLYKKSNI